MLNECNTNMQLSNFDAGVNHAGFSYAYMHSIAQCTLLSLYAVSPTTLQHFLWLILIGIRVI